MEMAEKQISEKESLIEGLYAKDSQKTDGAQIVILGPPGGGKTWASIVGAPNPCLIDLEGGAKRYGHLNKELKRIDAAALDWPQLMAVLDVVSSSKHQTVIIDTADAAAEILRQHLIQAFDIDLIKDSFNQGGRGYGHTTDVLTDYWRKFINKLSKMTSSGKHCIVICHVDEREVLKPGMRPVQKQEPRLPRKIAPLLTEWAELVGHLQLEESGDELETRLVRNFYISPDLHVSAKNRFAFSQQYFSNTNIGEILKLIYE